MVGSSSTSRRASQASSPPGTRALLARLRWCGKRSPKPPRPTAPTRRSPRGTAAVPACQLLRPNATSSQTVDRTAGRPDPGTGAPLDGAPRAGWPRPAAGRPRDAGFNAGRSGSRPLRCSSSVDLPAPFGPMRATRSPGASSASTRATPRVRQGNGNAGRGPRAGSRFPSRAHIARYTRSAAPRYARTVARDLRGVAPCGRAAGDERPAAARPLHALHLLTSTKR